MNLDHLITIPVNKDPNWSKNVVTLFRSSGRIIYREFTGDRITQSSHAGVHQ